MGGLKHSITLLFLSSCLVFLYGYKQLRLLVDNGDLLPSINNSTISVPISISISDERETVLLPIAKKVAYTPHSMSPSSLFSTTKLSPTPAPQESKDDTYMLVLFTTDVVLSSKVQNTIRMFSLFQQEFSFRAIMFTSNKGIQDFCESLHVTSLSNYTTNPYGLPYIGSLYQSAAAMFKAHFYGYINSDILVSPEIFDVLPFILREKEQKYPNQLIELCNNAYNARSPHFDEHTTISQYNRTFSSLVDKSRFQRPPSSVDIFVLTPEFKNITFENIVIARARVDTYMMYLAASKGGVLVDTKDVMKTVHQGMGTYTSRADKSDVDNFNWNIRVMGRRFIKLSAAPYVINKENGNYCLGRKRNIVSRKTK